MLEQYLHSAEYLSAISIKVDLKSDHVNKHFDQGKFYSVGDNFSWARVLDYGDVGAVFRRGMRGGKAR